ncbi:DoxX family protein [Tepidibacillus marianensis]|uniref:DoxX family protein n=1 Tax=Tepidibacillus marianensis TaxID=3131995 RepID=UPI0030CCF532
MLKALRGDKAAIFWTIVRIYIGYEFLMAGWEKITGPEPFSAKGFMMGAIKKSVGEHPAVQGWYASFLNGFAVPMHGLFDILIPWGELLAGIGLIIGCFTTIALLATAFMNLNFMLAGSTSTNPQLYTLAIILLFIGAASYRWGVDYYFLPKLKEMKKGQSVAS